jgi:hypothetical protein
MKAVILHELPDETKVNYSYKLPHEMLQHHVHYLFCRDDSFIYLALISL